MHSTIISRRLRAAASAALLAACGGDGSGPGGTPRTALLALARFDSFPPPATSVFRVENDRLLTFDIRHTDPGATLFAEFRFPAGSIVRVNSLPVCDTCTVNVSVTLSPGGYGFTVSPASLVFRSSSTPTVTVNYARFGDLSVYTSSMRYPTAAAFEQALELWFERDADAWVPSRNSSHPAALTVQSALDEPGAHLIAALK